MDLSSLRTTDTADEGAEMVVEHPITREPIIGKDGKKAVITLAGKDSATYNRVRNKRANRRLSRRNVEMTAEQIEVEALEILVACTLSWSGIEWEGKPLECNQDNARMLYKALPWLREQVDYFIDNRANFLLAS